MDPQFVFLARLEALPAVEFSKQNALSERDNLVHAVANVLEMRRDATTSERLNASVQNIDELYTKLVNKLSGDLYNRVIALRPYLDGATDEVPEELRNSVSFQQIAASCIHDHTPVLLQRSQRTIRRKPVRFGGEQKSQRASIDTTDVTIIRPQPPVQDEVPMLMTERERRELKRAQQAESQMATSLSVKDLQQQRQERIKRYEVSCDGDKSQKLRNMQQNTQQDQEEIVIQQQYARKEEQKQDVQIQPSQIPQQKLRQEAMQMQETVHSQKYQLNIGQQSIHSQQQDEEKIQQIQPQVELVQQDQLMQQHQISQQWQYPQQMQQYGQPQQQLKNQLQIPQAQQFNTIQVPTTQQYAQFSQQQFANQHIQQNIPIQQGIQDQVNSQYQYSPYNQQYQYNNTSQYIQPPPQVPFSTYLPQYQQQPSQQLPPLQQIQSYISTTEQYQHIEMSEFQQEELVMLVQKQNDILKRQNDELLDLRSDNRRLNRQLQQAQEDITKLRTIVQRIKDVPRNVSRLNVEERKAKIRQQVSDDMLKQSQLISTQRNDQ